MTETNVFEGMSDEEIYRENCKMLENGGKITQEEAELLAKAIK